MGYFDIVLEEKKKEGKQEGIIEGKQKGIIEGKQKGIIEGVNTSKLVIEALRAGQPVDAIAHETGLSVQEVTDIKEAMGL